MMTKEQRMEARERCEKATPGPWGYDLNGHIAVDDMDEWGRGIASIRGLRSVQNDDNAEFIAHTRTDLPAALDHIDELEAEIERLRKQAEHSDGQAIRMSAARNRALAKNKRLRGMLGGTGGGVTSAGP